MVRCQSKGLEPVGNTYLGKLRYWCAYGMGLKASSDLFSMGSGSQTWCVEQHVARCLKVVFRQRGVLPSSISLEKLQVARGDPMHMQASDSVRLLSWW